MPSRNGGAGSRSTNCPRVLLCGDDASHTRHLGPALLHRLEHLPSHVLDVTTLFEETGRAVEEAIIQKVKTARRSVPAVLYVPDLMTWWFLVDEPARAVFASLLDGLDSSVRLLLIATANCRSDQLPEQLTDLFDEHRGEVFELQRPRADHRAAYFKQLFSNHGAGEPGEPGQSSQGKGKGSRTRAREHARKY